MKQCLVILAALAHLGERQTEVYFGSKHSVRYLEVLCSIHRSCNNHLFRFCMHKLPRPTPHQPAHVAKLPDLIDVISTVNRNEYMTA